MLARYKEAEIGDSTIAATACNLFERVIYRCVIGSQAYGLADDDSDIDRRGIYLPPADLHWSLYGVPGSTGEPRHAGSLLGTPEVPGPGPQGEPERAGMPLHAAGRKATPLAEELLAMRSIFLSRLVYQTYNGYVLSQFKKMQADLRNKGQVKWKHVMHLIRLLLSGIRIMRDGFVPVRWKNGGLKSQMQSRLETEPRKLVWKKTSLGRSNGRGRANFSLGTESQRWPVILRWKNGIA